MLRGMSNQDRRDAIATPATVAAKAEVGSVTIRMRHHGWATWARIAIAHENEAKANQVKSADETDNILREFEPSLVAATAVAFALDALSGVAEGLGIRLQQGRRRANRGRKVAETLKRGTTATKSSSMWPHRMQQLFQLRREAVHFGEEDSSPEWHPVLQSNVGPEIRKWRYEVAAEAVDLLFEVLDSWAKHPAPVNKEWAERFAPSVEALHQSRQS